jgi:protein involved in polysaccharide export with SLBB domain
MNLLKLATVIAVALSVVWIFSSCAVRSAATADTPDVATSAVIADDIQTYPGPDPAIFPHAATPYLVRFGDELQINFNYTPELDRPVTVRPDGRVTLSWIGDLEVVGRTTDEIAGEIEEAYSEMVRNPELVVSVASVAPMRFYVFGEVRNPGFYDVQNRVTMLEAIAMAGGMTTRAEWKSVLIFHPISSDTGTVEQIDLENSISGDSYALHLVQSFDIIYVPPTFISNVNQFIREYFVNITPPVDSYIRNRYYWWFGRRE